MASVEQCQDAITRLVAQLDALDPATRAKHVPSRSVSCRVKDLDTIFSVNIGPDGAHDLCRQPDDSAHATADLRVAVSSADLVALADGDDHFVNAWVRGRVQVSAGVRDVLRLRSLLGL